MSEAIKKLVDRAVDLDRAMQGMKAKQDEIASKLQQEALAKMKEKKIKTVQYFGSNGNYVLVTKASTVKLLDYAKVKKVFGDNIKKMMTKRDAYDLKKEFKTIAEGIFKSDIENRTVKDILEEIGLEEKQIQLVTRQLKMDYVKDKKALMAIGLTEQDVETYIFFIHEAMVYEKIKEALSNYEGEAYEGAVTSIKNSVIVEETPKITIKYED